jgi:hypothetical protein
MTKRVLMLAIALVLVTSAVALACACTAGDGSCSASTNCGGGGCYAICGSGGCTSGCAGGGRANLRTLSFSGQSVSPSELQQRISDELGVQFVFAAKKLDDQFTVDVENASASDLMAGLAKIGAAAVVERKVGAEEKADNPLTRRFSLKAENVPTEAVSRLLAEIFGTAINVKAADPSGTVSLDMENVILSDVRDDLPRIAGIKLDPVSE